MPAENLHFARDFYINSITIVKCLIYDNDILHKTHRPLNVFAQKKSRNHDSKKIFNTNPFIATLTRSFCL